MKISHLPQVGVLIILITSSVMSAQDNSWTAPKSANDLKNPFINDKEAVSKGEAIFKQMCVVCHGAKGKGNGAAGVSLNPQPADFLALKVRDESDGAIFWKMTEGKPPMASYKDLLTEDQRWTLVSYIRQLEKENK